MTRSRGRILLWAAAGLLGAAAVGILFAFDPRTASIYPPCPFLALTGLLCPGCGITRALHTLLHGDVAQAFGLNPLLFLVPALLVLMQSLARAVPTARHRMHLRNAAAWVLLALVLGFWIGRNLPSVASAIS